MSRKSRISDIEFFNRALRHNRTYHRISPCPLCGSKVMMAKGRVSGSEMTKYTPVCTNTKCFQHNNHELYFKQSLIDVMLGMRVMDDGAVLRQSIVRWNRMAENVGNQRVKNHG